MAAEVSVRLGALAMLAAAVAGQLRAWQYGLVLLCMAISYGTSPLTIPATRLPIKATLIVFGLPILLSGVAVGAAALPDRRALIPAIIADAYIAARRLRDLLEGPKRP